MLITSEWSNIDYNYMLYSLSLLRLLGDNYGFPIYALKQKSNHNVYNHRTLHNYSQTLLSLLSTCIEMHNLKKITVISYEESAIITLLALSAADSSLIFKIDKLILINPFNP